MSKKNHAHAARRFKSASRTLCAGAELVDAACRDFEFPPHVHDGLTLGVVTDGRETIRYRNEDIPVATGVVYLIPPDTVHGARSYERGAWRYASLYLTPAWFQSVGGEIHMPSFEKKAPIIAGAAANQLAGKIRNIARDKDPMAIDIILIEITSLLRGSPGDDPRPYATSAWEKKVTEARDYIDAFYAHSLSLHDLAKQVGWSAQHLIHMFKKQVGATPYAYLTARRLAAAHRQIGRGEALPDIAASCGFYDQSHLNRHYVRVFGQTPGAYARSLSNI
ncbi:MAG: AraC family transcriptional regulator [Pseudomonadota bacterium]